MESEGESKKMSFSIDVGEGKKLRMIDMANEDDYLIASPLFDSLEDLRLSVTLDNSSVDENNKWKAIRPSAERLLQSEPKLFLSSNSSMAPGRPSYMRKSLAWDTAFFTNDGVLDADELFLLNKGLKTRSLPSIQEDMHLRRSEPTTTSSRKKVDSCTQKNSSKQVFREKLMSSLLQSSEKSKNQTARSEECKRMSSKPPKASGILKDLQTGRCERRLLGKKNDLLVSKEEMSFQTRAVSSFASRNLTPSNSQPRRVIATSPDISKNYLKRKTESTRGKLSSDITHSRYKEKSKRQATDLRYSTQSSAITSHSSLKSPSGSIVDRSLVENRKENPGSNPDNNFSYFLEEEISSPLIFSTSPVGTSSASSQSGLRMPSPTIGYFNEGKQAARTANGSLRFQLQMHKKSPSKSASRCRKIPAKVAKSALSANTQNRKHGSVDKQAPPSYGKLKTSSSVGLTASNLLTSSISGMEEGKLSKSRNFCAGKHIRSKIDHSSTLTGEEKRIKEISGNMLGKENKRHQSKTRINGPRVQDPHKKGNQSPQIGDQVNELSKLLGVVNLNEGKAIEPKQRGHLNSTLFKENISETYSDASPLSSAAESMLSTSNPLGKKNIRLV